MFLQDSDAVCFMLEVIAFAAFQARANGILKRFHLVLNGGQLLLVDVHLVALPGLIQWARDRPQRGFGNGLGAANPVALNAVEQLGCPTGLAPRPSQCDHDRSGRTIFGER